MQGSLPAGLTLNATTGLISGTPTAAGSFFFVAQVMDAQEVSATRPFTITIVPAPPLSITTTATPRRHGGNGILGEPGRHGRSAPLPVVHRAGFPAPGLDAECNHRGSSAARPRRPERFLSWRWFWMPRSDSATRTFSITILAARPSLITTTSISNGVVGVAYSTNLPAAGRDAPVHLVRCGRFSARRTDAERNCR